MKTNPVVEIIRASARPVISIIFAAAIAQLVTQGIAAPEWFLAVAIPCIVWWFGERVVGHIKANSIGNLDKLASKVAERIKGK